MYRTAINARIIPPTRAKIGPRSARVVCVPVATLATKSLAVYPTEKNSI